MVEKIENNAYGIDNTGEEEIYCSTDPTPDNNDNTQSNIADDVANELHKAMAELKRTNPKR